MQRVHLFVHEGRRQHGNADEKVPRRAEAGQRTVPEMGNFVDEQQRAVERENGNHRQRDGQGGIVYQDRPCQRGIARHGRADHVGPVDGGAMIGDILGQVARCAQHRLVVGDLRMPAAAIAQRRGNIGRNGLFGVHHRFSWGCP